MDLYYCVLKFYKGFFNKRHIGNEHLLIAPISQNEYLYLSILGQIVDEKDTYGTVMLTRLKYEHIHSLINYEKTNFGDRFVILEKLSCTPKKISDGKYSLKLNKKGKMILTDLKITYDAEYSGARKFYIINGKFNLEFSDVNQGIQMKMKADKSIAIMSRGESEFNFSEKE